mgnify:CR=1 FL=1
MDEAKNIIEGLKAIEKGKNVKILLAIESGSKAWDIESFDSDFDIRFIFKRGVEEYLSLDKKQDVIELIDKNLDYVGFDIFKFLQLIRNSNPSVIEWLYSPIVYKNRFLLYNILLKEVKNGFNPLALFHHYKSMCKQNYLKYLKSGNEVTYKKYLYAMRGLINSKWVLYKKSIPQVNFNDALNSSLNFIPKSILSELKEIIKLKKQGRENEIIRNIVKIDDYIESFLKSNEEPNSKKQYNLRIFNRILKANLKT